MSSLSGLGLYNALVLLLKLNVTKAFFSENPYTPNMLNGTVNEVVLSRCYLTTVPGHSSLPVFNAPTCWS